MSSGTITRRGKASWRIKYDLPRDPVTGERRIAYATVKGKRADAEKELRRRLHAIDKGVHVDPTNVTLSEYLDDWLEMAAPKTVGPKALERHRSLVEHQIKPHLGMVQIQKLRPADVARWLQTLGETKALRGDKMLSPRTIRHAHGVLRTALNYATAVEIVERNVASAIKPPKNPAQEIQILTSDQIADTLAKLKDHPSLYPVAVLALGTGMRRGELCALRWADIDLDRRTVRIERALEQTKEGLRVKTPKTKSGVRTISLPDFTIDALRDHRVKQLELRVALGAGALPAEAPVFGDIEGGWLLPSAVSDRWREAVRNRKLPKVTFHALRHTHVSALISAGLDVVSISRRIGHANPSITLGVYGHLFETDDSQAAAAIDAVLSK